MGTYVVTGGASGIGAATRQQLVAEGHRVIVIDIKGGDIVADLATREGREAAIAGVQKIAADGVDGLATCAALHPINPNETIVNVNYFGTLELIEGLRDLLRIQRGSVVLLSSHTLVLAAKDDLVEILLGGDRDRIFSKVSDMEGLNVYASIKKSLVIWMRRNVPAYAADGIRLNTVAPGYTQTPMTEISQKDPDNIEMLKKFAASIPVGAKAAQPEEIAHAINFLLGPRSSFICGALLFVDGGQDTILRPNLEQF